MPRHTEAVHLAQFIGHAETLQELEDNGLLEGLLKGEAAVAE